MYPLLCLFRIKTNTPSTPHTPYIPEPHPLQTMLMRAGPLQFIHQQVHLRYWSNHYGQSAHASDLRVTTTTYVPDPDPQLFYKHLHCEHQHHCWSRHTHAQELSVIVDFHMPEPQIPAAQLFHKYTASHTVTSVEAGTSNSASTNTQNLDGSFHVQSRTNANHQIWVPQSLKAHLQAETSTKKDLLSHDFPMAEKVISSNPEAFATRPQKPLPTWTTKALATEDNCNLGQHWPHLINLCRESTVIPSL